MLANLAPPSASSVTRAPARRATRASDGGHVPPSLPSTRSLPLPPTGQSRGGGLRGFNQGEEPLFQYKFEVVGWICCAYVGTARTRFCCRYKKNKEDIHCGNNKHGGEKFILMVDHLYVPMKDGTACCEPSVSVNDLRQRGRSDYLWVSHSSKKWLELLKEFVLPDQELMLGGVSVSSPMRVETVLSQESLEERDGTLYGAVKIENSQYESSELGDNDAENKAVLLEAIAQSRHDLFASFKPESFFSSGDGLPDDRSWTVPMSITRNALDSIRKSVESAVESLPSQLNELDLRFANQLSQVSSKLQELAAGNAALEVDLFGNAPSEEFFERYCSFADAILHGESMAETTKSIAETAHSLAESVSLALGGLESDVSDINEELRSVVEKFILLYKAATDRIVSVETSLSDRISALEGDEVTLQAPSIAPSHKTSASQMLDQLLSGTGQSGGSKRSSHQPSSAATHSITSSVSSVGQINDSDSTLTKILELLQKQSSEIKNLQTKLSVYEQTGSSATGVTVGPYAFDSEMDILELIKKEDIPVKVFGVALDAISFFAHYLSGHAISKQNTDEIKALRNAGIHDAVCGRYISSYRQKHPSYFLDTSDTPVAVGSRFPMLESKKAWEGTASFKGGRENLQKAIAEATKTAKKYIEQQLPVGTIRNLCHHLLTETNTWLKDLIEHICKELQTVTQYGIPEKNTYTLVCDELQLIFDALWDKRMCMQEFASEQDHQLYFARSIFITMEAHMVMADFKSTDFANHVLITSLFVRFLAEQTGQNFSAGLNSTLASIRDDVEKNEKKNERAHKAINSRLDNHTENIKGLAGKSEFKYVPWKPSAGTTG